MMDSPPQLSLPPELKSSLDQSELVVRQLTGEHLVVDNATEIDSPWFRTRDRGQPRERRTCSLAEHCCISHVCLGSLRASRERLNGQNLAAESGLCRQLYRLEPSIVLFKKNDPKPQNAH